MPLRVPGFREDDKQTVESDGTVLVKGKVHVVKVSLQRKPPGQALALPADEQAWQARSFLQLPVPLNITTIAMSWAHPSSWVSSLLGPSPRAIAITLVAALVIPLLLHFILYRSTSRKSLPSFLLIGPSNSGKTSLLTYVGFLVARGVCIKGSDGI